MIVVGLGIHLAIRIIRANLLDELLQTLRGHRQSQGTIRTGTPSQILCGLILGSHLW